MPLKVQYPQGGEKQLIDAVIRRQVKSGALPISAGAVVQNVGTALRRLRSRPEEQTVVRTRRDRNRKGRCQPVELPGSYGYAHQHVDRGSRWYSRKHG